MLACPAFSDTLTRHGIDLCRGTTNTLQINVGLLCNQSCRHCHLEAGPERKEIMSAETVRQVVRLESGSWRWAKERTSMPIWQ